MATSFFLDVHAPDFQDKMTAMYKSLDDQDPLLCALIGAAHVDKCLVTLLEAMMPVRPTSGTKLRHFDPDHPSGILNSLYARAEFAYLFGLINGQTMTTIGQIASIRNLFAHSHEPLTFNSDKVKEICTKMKDDPAPIVTIDDPELGEVAREVLEFFQNDPYHKFVRAVSGIVIHLSWLPSQLRQPPSPFKDPAIAPKD